MEDNEDYARFLREILKHQEKTMQTLKDRLEIAEKRITALTESLTILRMKDILR